MSVRAVQWSLWLLAFCTAPLPYMIVGLEIAPPLRLAFITGITAALQISEGSGGWMWHTILALGAIQLAAYLFGLYLVAGLLARLSGRLPARQRVLAVSLLAAAVLVLAVGKPIYQTPTSSAAIDSNLLQVLL